MAARERIEEGAPTNEELEAKLRDRPDDLESLLVLGWDLYAYERYDDAVDVLQATRKKYPDDAEAGYALGLALKQIGRKDEARQAFQSALENLESNSGDIRSDMMRKLAGGQINLLDHGSWDINEL
jgi:Flp pilus assembly protein TadD